MIPRKLCCLLFLLLTVFSVLYIINPNKLFLQALNNMDKKITSSAAKINIAVVSCIDRAEDALVMIKSAIIFGTAPLHVHIFLKDEDPLKINTVLKHWQKITTWREFTFDIREVSFPHSEEWNKLKPIQICSSLRIYLPDMHPQLDSLLYVDADTLFLSPPEDFWTLYPLFTSKQIAALALDQIDRQEIAFKGAKHPFYKPYGLNSGVILMNLTRMRTFNWTSRLYPIVQQYRQTLTFGEQGVINIIFHDNPDVVFVLNCTWNLNPVECLSIQNRGINIRECQPMGTGVYLLHGLMRYFHRLPRDKIIFKTIYDTIKDYQLGSNFTENLYKPLEKKLIGSFSKRSRRDLVCGTLVEAILKRPKAYAELLDRNNTLKTLALNNVDKKITSAPKINVAVVSCLDRTEETLAMIKSAIIFGTAPLHVHIYLKDDDAEKMNNKLKHWQKITTWREFTFDIHEVSLPHSEEWNKFKPIKLCSSQRLYLPDMLPQLDSLLYVDTDTLFLSPPEDFWTLYPLFTSKQIAALALDQIDKQGTPFKGAKHPFYEPYGLNSGVILMNLTRMRTFNWTARLYPIVRQYRQTLTFGEQGVVNIIFHDNPDLVFVLNCTYNLNPMECQSIQNKGINIRECQPMDSGVYLLHGLMGNFHFFQRDKIIFKYIYDTIKDYELGSDFAENLYKPLEKKLIGSFSKHSRHNLVCGTIVEAVLKRPKAYAELLDRKHTI